MSTGPARATAAHAEAGPDSDERRDRALLTRVAEPGDETVGRWLEDYGPAEIVRRLRGGPPPPGTSARRWEGLRLRAHGVRPGADLAAASTRGVRFVCPGDPDWPVQLDDLGPCRPYGLWVRGAPSLRFWALRSVAVVGARACTDYGVHVAAALGAGLAARGWTVVSGAAYGVDGAAHRGALGAGGATVGVLACGVDVAYPPGHSDLIRRLGECGLLVAELPPGSHPTRGRFVLRNRVIAALTRGTVVVEAEQRSGSLVTARRARDLSRVVMGVPGPVTSGLSTGVHRLLQHDAAAVVTDADEVIEMVGAIGELAPEQEVPVLPRDLLPPEAARVLEALPARAAVTVPQLAAASATPTDRVLVRLHELRALGFVGSAGDRWWLLAPVPRASEGCGRPSPQPQ
ncbi:DNA-protecting protein DprA [Streptomyces sp. RKND-216]|uniref:DNA-processing protein DprA n=1 Tax=Streptomyces sp. RKND-216 TaxID=2562581 RepID=UPI00109D884B|nr:DNA-processing protein DprA [Streptomyces sp. RKND-216]THA24270.1 DNA-protecting protein DprA [Streptomyces sp. RKND-216]